MRSSLLKTVFIGFFLVLISLCLYIAHYNLFHDIHHILIYFVGDIAFIPIEVLIITLIIHRILDKREKQQQLKKLNMVIGVFFSEIGDEIIEIFIKRDKNLEELKNYFLIDVTWKKYEYKQSKKFIKSHKYDLNMTKKCFVELAVFLKSKRDFLLKLIENPSILEHEQFTDLLMAIFHLEEELARRKDLQNLGEKDKEHIIGDIKRVYLTLFVQWLEYARHTQKEYPYLFSFLVRTNPFSGEKTVELLKI